MEGTVERIEATTTKNGKNKWRVWINGDEHTDWDRPNYTEGAKIAYTLQEKPKQDGNGTWKTIRDARPMVAPTPTPETSNTPTLTIPSGAYLDAAVAIASKKCKFSDVMEAYGAVKDMVESPEEEEPEQSVQEEMPI